MSWCTFLKPGQIGRQFAIRYYGKHNKKYLYDNGVLYNKLFYYPRDANHKDPHIEPAKLFRVQRVKTLKGTPYWEKHIMKDLGLDKNGSYFAVVKNIPEVNALLWKVKHLIKVTPITFPYGEPTENDIKHTILKDNGECIVTKQIGPVMERLEAAEKHQNDPQRLTQTLLLLDARKKWISNW